MSIRTPRIWMWSMGVALVIIQALAIVSYWHDLTTAAPSDTSDLSFGLPRIIILAGLIAGAVWIAAMLALTRRAWRRMQDQGKAIAEAADRFGGGDLNHAIAVVPGAELAPLAEAFNRMAERLHHQLELLQARHNEQRIIQESMSAGIIALDLNQRVLSANGAAERLLGLQEQAAQGRLLRDSLHQPELNRFMTQALESDKPASAEFTLLGGDGATLHVTGEPLRNDGGDRVGLLLLINDITRLKRLEGMRSDFAANVSHELRTPITNIKGYVETLMEAGSADIEQTRKFLAVIHRNTERLASIIEDLLALARLEQPDARGALERTVTPLRTIINAAIAQFEETAAPKHITMHVELAPAELCANVNAPLLEQALGNLLSNAIKFSPPHTTVTIRAGVANGRDLEIAVQDQGPGIARDHLPRLFERFYRVDRARSRAMGGTGLGLAIVKHIALVHGGRAEVQSELGRGSTFRMVLPMI